MRNRLRRTASQNLLSGIAKPEFGSRLHYFFAGFVQLKFGSGSQKLLLGLPMPACGSSSQ